MKPPAVWVIKKIREGRYQAKIHANSAEGFLAYVLEEDYSKGEWRGKITCSTGTFDGWEDASFRLKFSDDLKTITGGYTYWNNWAKYNYKMGATRK